MAWKLFLTGIGFIPLGALLCCVSLKHKNKASWLLEVQKTNSSATLWSDQTKLEHRTYAGEKQSVASSTVQVKVVHGLS